MHLGYFTVPELPSQVGKMFEEENEAELKDQLDFSLSLDVPMLMGMPISFFSHVKGGLFTSSYF